MKKSKRFISRLTSVVLSAGMLTAALPNAAIAETYDEASAFKEFFMEYVHDLEENEGYSFDEAYALAEMMMSDYEKDGIIDDKELAERWEKFKLDHGVKEANNIDKLAGYTLEAIENGAELLEVTISYKAMYDDEFREQYKKELAADGYSDEEIAEICKTNSSAKAHKRQSVEELLAAEYGDSAYSDQYYIACEKYFADYCNAVRDRVSAECITAIMEHLGLTYEDAKTPSHVNFKAILTPEQIYQATELRIVNSISGNRIIPVSGFAYPELENRTFEKNAFDDFKYSYRDELIANGFDAMYAREKVNEMSLDYSAYGYITNSELQKHWEEYKAEKNTTKLTIGLIDELQKAPEKIENVTISFFGMGVENVVPAKYAEKLRSEGASDAEIKAICKDETTVRIYLKDIFKEQLIETGEYVDEKELDRTAASMYVQYRDEMIKEALDERTAKVVEELTNDGSELVVMDTPPYSTGLIITATPGQVLKLDKMDIVRSVYWSNPEVSDVMATECFTVSPTTAAAVLKYGDANCDNIVSMADAALILQYIGNADKYPLSAAGLANSDCYNAGDGISSMDALAIQQLDAGIVKSLPVKK